MPLSNSTYQTPAAQKVEVTKEVANQEWIPREVQRLIQEDIKADRRSRLVKTASQAFLNNRACNLWHVDSKVQALKETGWTPVAKFELSWWHFFPRLSVTRLSRFLSGHLPTKAYLARFHCPTEQTRQCRFGC